MSDWKPVARTNSAIPCAQQWVHITGLLVLFFLSGPALGQRLSPQEITEIERSAQKQYQNDDLNGAAKSYSRLADQSSTAADRSRFALLAAWIYHQAGNADERDSALELALQQDPSLRPSPDAFSVEFLQRVQVIRIESEAARSKRSAELTREARAALQRGDAEVAIARYRELIELEPSRDAVRLQLAVTLLNAGEPDEAIETLAPLNQRIETLDPSSQRRTRVLSATARIRSGDTNGAEAAIRRVSSQEQRRLWLELAAAYQRTENWEAAIAAYGSVLEIDPADRQTAIFRSQLLNQLGRRTEAESFLINLSETLPNSSAVWHQLGSLREQMDDLPGALAAYQRAVEVGAIGGAKRDPVDSEGLLQARIGIAGLLRETDPEAARTSINSALAMAPNSSDALAMSARLLADQGQHDKAILLARKALEAEPNRTDLLNLLGNTFYLAGRYQEAVAVFESLLDGHPELDAVRDNLEAARKLAAKPSNGTLARKSSNAALGTPPSATPSSTNNDNDNGTTGKPESATKPTKQTSKTDAPGAMSSPSGLPIGLTAAPIRWARTGRKVLRVEAVATGSKVDRCGLVIGDLLIRIGGEAATTFNEAERSLQGDTSGLRIDIVRGTDSIALVCI